MFKAYDPLLVSLSCQKSVDQLADMATFQQKKSRALHNLNCRIEAANSVDASRILYPMLISVRGYLYRESCIISNTNNGRGYLCIERAVSLVLRTMDGDTCI